MKGKVRMEAAEDAAKLLKAAWGDLVPVDPVTIARTAGLRVLEAELDEKTLGALVKNPGEDPVILLNQGDGANRKRFTCAHELGHFVRRSAEEEEYATVDLRNSHSSTGLDPEERYANEFAASLLMPEDAVESFVEEGIDDLEMAIRFKVSREAMQNRLDNLNLTAAAA